MTFPSLTRSHLSSVSKFFIDEKPQRRAQNPSVQLIARSRLTTTRTDCEEKIRKRLCSFIIYAFPLDYATLVMLFTSTGTRLDITCPEERISSSPLLHFCISSSHTRSYQVPIFCLPTAISNSTSCMRLPSPPLIII